MIINILQAEAFGKYATKDKGAHDEHYMQVY